MVSGNRNTDPSVHFIGTTDLQDLMIRTNNLQRILIGADGNIQFGTQSQPTDLNVNGNANLTGVIKALGGAQFGDQPDYATFSSSGDLRFFGAADYLVSANRHVFRAAEDEDIGLYYDGSSSQLKITGDAATSLFSIHYTSGNSSFTGNVGIGIAASSAQALNVKGNTALDGNAFVSGNVGIGIAATTTEALTVKGNTDLDGNADISGSLGIGTAATATEALSVIGNSNFDGDASFSGEIGVGGENADPSNYTLYVNGRLRSNGINELSDRRMKRNIASLDGALASVLRLRGVHYEWQREAYPALNLPSGKQIGLIAQEVERVVPEVVLTDAEGTKSVEYSHIVPLLIEAMKEQQATIEQQARSLEEMRAELEGLRQVVGRVVREKGGELRLTRADQK